MSKKVNMGIPSLPSQKISKVVFDAYFNMQPLLLYGSPGTGKSQGVFAGGEDIKDFLNLRVLAVNPSLASKEDFIMALTVMSGFTPEDINGQPYIDGDDGNKKVKWAQTGLIPVDDPELKGIVFFDEAGNAEDYKMGPLQSLITERMVGNWRVPDGIQFVIATNKPEDGTGARELPSAIRNRCMQFDVIAPTGEDFIKLMRDIDRKLHKYVEGFLLTFPSESYTFEAEKTASATLRSWERISDMLKTTKNLQDEVMMIGSMVGTDIAMKFKAWRKLSDKIKLSEIIAKPSLVKDYEYDKGMLYNIALGLLDHGSTRKNIADVFNVMLELTHDEFSIYIIKNMLDIHPHNVLAENINKAPNKQAINDKLKQYKEYYF